MWGNSVLRRNVWRIHHVSRPDNSHITMGCTCILHTERTDFHGNLSERVDLKDEDIARRFPYLITPCNRVLTEKLSGFQLVKKFPTF